MEYTFFNVAQDSDHRDAGIVVLVDITTGATGGAEITTAFTFPSAVLARVDDVSEMVTIESHAGQLAAIPYHCVRYVGAGDFLPFRTKEDGAEESA